MRRLIPAVTAATFACACPSSGDTPLTDSSDDSSGDMRLTDGDGEISDEEIRRFCQGFNDCDPMEFQQSYDGVDDCVTQKRTEIDERVEERRDADGEDCAAVTEQTSECSLGIHECIDSTWSYESYYSDECYYSTAGDYDRYGCSQYL